MNPIKKAFLKLAPKEQVWVNRIITQLNMDDFTGLDVKKLKGWGDIFRIRKGVIRIIYRKSGPEIVLLFIGRKKENTYDF